LIRSALPEDLEPLCQMAKRFIDETLLPLTFDPDLTRDIFWKAINDENSVLIVDLQDGILSGAIMGFMERDFCKEYSAYISKLYVEKEFRGLPIAKDLIRAFEEKTPNALLTYSSATAGMGETIEKLYVRLFERSGYQVLGRVLLKER